jgi:hypothetical protein
MYIAPILKRRWKLMKIWVRNGLTLLVALGLLTLGHNQLFTPALGRIPDGVIENRKATQDEKKHNKKLAQDYAAAGWDWRGKEWECLKSLWTVRAGLITMQKTSKEVPLTELLNSLERKIVELNSNLTRS